MPLVIDTHYKPTPEQAVCLFASVSWGRRKDYCLEEWQQILKGTHTIVTARVGDSLIGMARFSTDDGSETHMHEIAVRPEYQRRGIGRRIMSYASSLFSHTEIYLGSMEETEDFFRACGYYPKEQMIVFGRDKVRAA